MKKCSLYNCLKVVFVIIGTLVGAGFASGKEIYSFFMVENSAIAIVRVFISSSIIGIVVYRVLKICSIGEINTYQNFCGIIKNKMFSNFLNNIVTIFLAISYFAMISGFSSFMNQEFNLNKFVAGGIIVLICYYVFMNDIKGLIKISDYLIPGLIIFIFIISSKDIYIFDQIQSPLIRQNWY